MYVSGHQLSPRYDARAHLAWLLTQPGFRAAIGRLRADARRRRQQSLPWREYAITELQAGAGDRDRGQRYLAGQRRLAGVLPPALRALLPLLLLNADVPIQVGVSRSLRDPRQVQRLQRLCLKRLDPDQPALSEAERTYLRRKLTAINPRSCHLRLSVSADSCPWTASAPVHTSATSAAAGSWIAYPSVAGHPAIGLPQPATATPDLLVKPLPLPAPPAQPHPAAFHRREDTL